MRSKQAILAAVAATMIIGSSVLPALVDEPPPPILGEPLTGRAVFVDDIGMKIKIGPVSMQYQGEIGDERRQHK